MTSRVRLTNIEIEALLAAAGNIDPCMFEEMDNEKRGEQMFAAWNSGQQKLRLMLQKREGKI
jgi:hypothetical protein